MTIEQLRDYYPSDWIDADILDAEADARRGERADQAYEARELRQMGRDLDDMGAA